MTKEHTLFWLEKHFLESEAVVLAKTSKIEGALTIECSEILKSKDGAPQVGDVIEIAPNQGTGGQRGDAIVFYHEFPITEAGWGAWWFSHGYLGLCRELSVSNIREALVKISEIPQVLTEEKTR